MVRVGQAPYLECSSRGDTRFSAFYARIKSRGNKSIEVLYQAEKIIDGRSGLTWKEVKGKKAENAEHCAQFYEQLWNEYIAENPELLIELRKASGLSDMFGQRGHCCQALSLWRIRNARQD